MATIITACSPSPQQQTLSKNQPNDIKNDLDTLYTISKKQVKNSPYLNQNIAIALKSQQESQVKQAVEKVDQFVKNFNKDLSSAQIKSTEADILRQQLIYANDTALELAQAGISVQSNTQKIDQLTQQAKQAQSNIEQTMLTLQQQIQAQPSRH
ncbi:hypothetical protein [Acinetobacter boissieri]|nr:hypothetical protein [Acinetobacter boissieri]